MTKAAVVPALWKLPGGVEVMVQENWILRMEYLLSIFFLRTCWAAWLTVTI